MATDYFQMMRDTVGSYGEGVDVGRKRQYEDERRAREKATFDQQQLQWNRENQRAGEEDRAFADMRVLQAGGTPVDPAAMNDGPPVQAMGLQVPRQPSRLETNAAMQRIAAARRDINAMSTLGKEGDTLQEDDLMAKAMAKVNKDGIDPEAARWLNNNHGKVTLLPADKNGIVGFTVVNADGDATLGKLSRADQAKLAGAQAIYALNPTRAWQLVGEVNKDLAAALATDNKTTLDAGKGNNDGRFHSGSLDNQRITAGAAATTAGAAARNAATNERYHGIQGELIQRELDSNTEARALVQQFNALTPEEQNGPKGQALSRQFDMLNAKPGSGLRAGGRGPAAQVKYQKNDDGTFTATDALTGEPKFNLVSGLKMPLGMGPQDWAKAQKEGASAGAPAAIVQQPDGSMALGYVGRDGQAYATIAEAQKAKPSRGLAVPGSSTPPAALPSGMPGGGGNVQAGYSVPDARGLLRTPSYSAGMSRFNPND